MARHADTPVHAHPRRLALRLAWLLPALLAAAPLPVLPQPAPLPGHGPAPLLYVRLVGPEGMHTTWYQGRAKPREFGAPTTVGLRPGYIYRVQISDLPGRPEVSLAPTLEVRNTLALPPGIHAAKFPAPIVFTEADIAQAMAGSLVTKVVFLEHPDKAAPVATRKDEPLEIPLGAERDALAEARDRGRPMVIVRLGGRILSPAEFAEESIPGTVLFPGEKSMAWPAVPPPLAWACVPLYDPRLGPKPPEEECLHDGGDRLRPAGFDQDGKLAGLDPEDAVAEYTDSAGRRRIAPSNRVCLCVPRFAVLRTELPIGRYDHVVKLDDSKLALGQDLLKMRQPPLLAGQADQLRGYTGRQRPTNAVATQGPNALIRIEVLQAHSLETGLEMFIDSPKALQLTEVQRLRLAKQVELARVLNQKSGVKENVQVTGTSVVARNEGGVEVIRATAETRDISCVCGKEPCLPDLPLKLCKWADRISAQVGDEVTFSLKYSNVGGRPMTDVAVSDSLSGRLEYVEGSAQADRDAVFTLQPNEAGSTILRWEIGGRLLPGQYGIVRFKARVR